MKREYKKEYRYWVVTYTLLNDEGGNHHRLEPVVELISLLLQEQGKKRI